ncbi:LysR family transcriptional regulator [Paenirhodobacter enshiensis]|jgi:DNA-binding transcriptional LysR family regulator|uniref:LysR family transcriptional regulator n=1 Tax=Paenirhodobacter enshiensis TaxID=1105367 RepID=A0A086XTT7_9RHOB|nr:LysR family transcriptional regulator [Paenirhodobacter enshiensis]KFI25437.1 LysR family transcriptional regulator [Paenirhodobacter enshiensis]
MKEKVYGLHNYIELRHLRHFVAAAEHGSFRKAGAALGLSQSAISRCIAELEDQIGASLFHRHTWGVSQTFAGQQFLNTARNTLRMVGEGAHDVSAAGRGESGCVRIGIYSSTASGFLTDLLRRYGERHRNVRIEMIDGAAYEHVAAIRRLRLDVAFLAGERDWSDCERTQLWSEHVFVAMPDCHPLATCDSLAWCNLIRENFIVSAIPPGDEVHAHLVRELAGAGERPCIEVQSVGLDNLLALVALGRGLTLVCEAMTVAKFPGVSYRPIIDEILSFSAVWSANNDNPAFRRLLSLAKMIAVRPTL